MLGHCFLKYKLARDMTYDRQQLLWQKQITTMFHQPLLPYQRISHWCSPISTRRLSPSLCAKTAFCSDVIILCRTRWLQSVIQWIFSVANVNSFLSLKRIKITSFGNSFEHKGLACLVSISCPEGVSLNTSNYGRGDKMICTTQYRAIYI